MRRSSELAALLLTCVVLATACAEAPIEPASAPGPRTRVVEVGPMPIDQIYHSMQGPHAVAAIDTSGLDWVTTYSTEVVDATTGDKLGDEFFCHSQLQLSNSTRLMVTATGAEEIRFPDGFAMPVSQIVNALPESQRETRFLGMILNNHRPEIDLQAKVRATLEYWTHDDAGSPSRFKKLYKVGLPIGVDDLESLPPEEQQAAANQDVSTHCVLLKPGWETHWYVPPGEQRVVTTYSDFVAIDAQVHYAVVHLHNYATYLRLTDTTTGEILWQTDVEYEEDRVQIARIPIYSSSEGFPIYRDHVYEVEALYNNTTDHDVDAMALIDLYYNPAGNVDISYPSAPEGFGLTDE